MTKHRIKLEAGVYHVWATGTVAANGKARFTSVEAKAFLYDTEEEAGAFASSDACASWPIREIVEVDVPDPVEAVATA